MEFALIAPILFTMILETVQLGLYFYASASLDRATAGAARQILTGSVANQNLTAAKFRSQILCPLLPSSIPCSSIITNIQTVPEATYPGGYYAFLNGDGTGLAMPQMNNNTTSFCPGDSSSYVYIQVYYAMPPISPLWTFTASSWNGNNVHFVGSVATFKNEPFLSTAQTPCS